MCLGIPACVVSRGEGTSAEIEVGGVRREIDLTLVPEAQISDYVLVHVGYAIQLIDEAEAQATFDLLRQMAEGPSADRAVGDT